MAKAAAKTKRGARKPAARAKTKKGAAKRAVRAGAKRRPTAKRAARPSVPRADPVRELAKRIVALTVASDDEGTLALYADDVESVEQGQPPMVGLDAIKQKFNMWRGMTSSASFRPRNVVVDGNVVVIEWEGTVTLAPSGKTVQLNEVAVHEIENGKIARERFYYDPSQLQQ